MSAGPVRTAQLTFADGKFIAFVDSNGKAHPAAGALLTFADRLILDRIAQRVHEVNSVIVSGGAL